MTTNLADRISLRSPAALCCALPHLLGFHPQSSAVLLWLRSGRILLTQRLDLPSSEELVPTWVRVAWRHEAAPQADELVLVLVVPDGLSSAHRVAAEAVKGEAGSRGIPVRDILALVGDRWSSLLCTDPACCPPAGSPIPDEVRALVDTEFRGERGLPKASRSEVVAELARDDQLAQVLSATGLLQRRRWRHPAARESWRDDALANLLNWMSRADAEWSPPRCAHLLLGLRDVRVRDTALWELTHGMTMALRTAQDQLIRLLRAAPRGDTAPVGTCVAVVCWLQGDGVRALASVERALEDDPGYSLARLVERAIASGVPPQAWFDTMKGLSRDICRHGDALPSEAGLL